MTSVYDLFADMAAEATRPELAWMDSASCASVGGDEWFPEKGGTSIHAKAVCRSCPVRAECGEYAIENEIPWGVWGGLSPKQRQAARRQRRTGQVAA